MKVKVNKLVKRFPLPVLEPLPKWSERKSVVSFLDSYEIIENYLTAEQFNSIPYSVRHYLRFFESFEPQSYIVKDNKTVTVLDSVNGDVFEEDIPLQKFINDALRYAGEQVVEEETE